MSLDDLEKQLYGLSPEQEQQREKNKVEENVSQVEKSQEEKVSSAWANDIDQTISSEASKGVEQVGFYTKAVFWVLVVAVLVGGGLLYYFFNQYLKSKDFTFDIQSPSRVMLAQPFEVKIDIQNKSQATMKNPKIIIQLPDGFISANGNAGKQTLEEITNDLNPGSMTEKVFKIVAIKDPQTVKKITAVFSYLPQNINTRFERGQEFDINIDNSVIDLNLITPQKVFNREAFDLSVKYKNVSQFDILSAKIKVIYPNNFNFINIATSTLATSTDKNTFLINNFAKDKEDLITIKGMLEGVDQSASDVKTQLIMDFGSGDQIILEKTATLSIASSPLTLSIGLNNQNYLARPGTSADYIISYKNNTDVALRDVIIKAFVKGDMINGSVIQTKGFYDAKAGTILWNVSNVPELQSLAPGAQGSVGFNLALRPDYPIKRLFDKNFVIKINAEINSPTVPYSVSSDKTIGYASYETKIVGDAKLLTTISKIKGPATPRAGKKSIYEVKFQVINYSSDIKDATVKTFLQTGIRWLNVVKSNIDQVPSYNERTNEVVWQIGKILATKGVVGSPTETSFQIEVVPTSDQIGKQIVLTDKIDFSAIDEFANIPLTYQILPIKIEQAVGN